MSMKQRLCHFYRMLICKTDKERRGHKGRCSIEHELQCDVLANRANVIPVHNQRTVSWNCTCIWHLWEHYWDAMSISDVHILRRMLLIRKELQNTRSRKPVRWWQTKDNKWDYFVKKTVAKLLEHSLQVLTWTEVTLLQSVFKSNKHTGQNAQRLRVDTLKVDKIRPKLRCLFL